MPTYYIKKEKFKPIFKEEIEIYLKKVKNNEFKVLLALAWLTGARISELLELTPEDFLVDKEKDLVSITIKAKKHGKVGFPTFSLKDPFIDLILDFLKTFKEGEKLFKKSKRRYQQMLLELNKKIYPNDKSKWITFHYLRHSRLTFLARFEGATPEELKSWTGHRSSAFESYFAPRRVERFKGKIR